MHSRPQLPELLPPQRLILLRPLADASSNESTKLSAGTDPRASGASKGKAASGDSPTQQPAQPKPGGTAVTADSALPRSSSEGGVHATLPDDVPSHQASGHARCERDVEDGSAKGTAGAGEQWDAVYLEPKELMEEGILLSANWRKHHGGPHILAAFDSALSACSV